MVQTDNYWGCLRKGVTDVTDAYSMPKDTKSKTYQYPEGGTFFEKIQTLSGIVG